MCLFSSRLLHAELNITPSINTTRSVCTELCCVLNFTFHFFPVLFFGSLSIQFFEAALCSVVYRDKNKQRNCIVMLPSKQHISWTLHTSWGRYSTELLYWIELNYRGAHDSLQPLHYGGVTLSRRAWIQPHWPCSQCVVRRGQLGR